MRSKIYKRKCGQVWQSKNDRSNSTNRMKSISSIIFPCWTKRDVRMKNPHLHFIDERTLDMKRRILHLGTTLLWNLHHPLRMVPNSFKLGIAACVLPYGNRSDNRFVSHFHRLSCRLDKARECTNWRDSPRMRTRSRLRTEDNLLPLLLSLSLSSIHILSRLLCTEEIEKEERRKELQGYSVAAPSLLRKMRDAVDTPSTDCIYRKIDRMDVRINGKFKGLFSEGWDQSHLTEGHRFIRTMDHDQREPSLIAGCNVISLHLRRMAPS